jgi:hypothetical protein
MFIAAVSFALGSFLTAWFAKQSAVLALKGVERQLALSGALKIAEFRQQWINTLRDSMSELQALAVTEGSEAPEFHRLGLKIDLLMNRKDPRYSELHGYIASFMRADNERERWQCSADYTIVCQDILKTEWEVLKNALATLTDSTSS